MSRPVLFVLPQPVFGGAERLAAAIMTHLRHSGHIPQLAIASHRPDVTESSAAWFEPVGPIHRLFGRPDLFAALMEVIDRHAITALAVCGHSPVYGLLPRLSGVRPDIRIVSFQFNAVQCIAENRRYGAQIDMIIAETIDAARALTLGGTMSLPVSIISSGVDAKAIAARPRMQREGERLCLAFVGRFDEAKNPEGFVKMAAAINSRSLRYVMAGDGALSPKANALAASLGIEMRGLLSDEALQALMDEIDILIVPSRIDGRPLIIQEAQARKIPVVASRVGGIPELVEDGMMGFLCARGDDAAFARAALRLAEDDDLRTRMGEAGFRRVMREGDIADVLPRYAAAITGEPEHFEAGTIASSRCVSSGQGTSATGPAQPECV